MMEVEKGQFEVEHDVIHIAQNSFAPGLQGVLDVEAA